MVGLKTTMVIDKDPLGTQGKAEEDAAELQHKIEQSIAHPTAEVVPRPQDTQPLNPMATKVVEHKEVQTTETAPGVQARLSDQEPTGSTRVVLHDMVQGDAPGRGAMGGCRMQVIDDPIARAAAGVAALPEAVKKAAKKKVAKKKVAKKKVAKKKVAKKKVVKKATKKKATKKKAAKKVAKK